MFCVREFIQQYSCPLKNRVYNQKHARSRLIGGIVKSKFKNHKRKYTPKKIQEDVLETIGLDVSYMVCWRARKLALESLRGKPTASYSKLPSYIYILNNVYQGSHIRMEKTPTNEFLYLYVSLYPFIRDFEHCKLVVIVDACHMKRIYKGTFVCASTMDGAGHIFSLAYGVIDSENNASWTWFFERFKEAYRERKNMCVVSDRNESIIKVVTRVYPGMAHYACMWHLWNNVKKYYRKSHDALIEVFYTMAKAYKRSDFNQLMKKVEIIDMRVKEYLHSAGYEKWARYFAPVHRGYMMTSNIAESINATIVSARELPIYHFLEEVRLLFGRWNFEYRQEASFTFTHLAGTNQKLLTENEAKCTRMKVVPFTEFLHTVHDKDRHFIVCLKEKTCTCVQFQIDEMPCSHACAVLRKKGFEAVDYTSDLYKPKTVLMTYDMPIHPLPDELDWVIPDEVQKELVLPPRFKRLPGRPKKVDR